MQAELDASQKREHFDQLKIVKGFDMKSSENLFLGS